MDHGKRLKASRLLTTLLSLAEVLVLPVVAVVAEGRVVLERELGLLLRLALHTQ